MGVWILSSTGNGDRSEWRIWLRLKGSVEGASR